MTRIACVLIGMLALLPAGSPADVDAVGLPPALRAGSPAYVYAVFFLRAFRAGTADQYRNQRIRGSGLNCHGAISERIGDGTTRTSLVITVGAAVGDGGAPALIKTWEEFVAAERARTTGVVALSGSDLPASPGP